MKIVNVIPLKKGVFKNDLTYFTSKNIDRGNIVKITLRGKEILGLVLSTEDVSGAKINIKDLNFNLKKILLYVNFCGKIITKYGTRIFSVNRHFPAYCGDFESPRRFPFQSHGQSHFAR